MGSYVIFIVIAFISVAAFIIIYTRRLADSALTDQFRAAERIANGCFPEKWARQIHQRLAFERMIPALQREDSGTKQALRKMDGLIQFFEKSRFFETAEARELLMAQLKETRQRWEKMTWEEILKEREPGAQTGS